MSTYYFLVCEKHKEFCDGASRSAGGFGHVADSSVTLPPFIITHNECELRVASEHEELKYDKELGYTDWDEQNYKKLYKNPLENL